MRKKSANLRLNRETLRALGAIDIPGLPSSLCPQTGTYHCPTSAGRGGYCDHLCPLER